MANILPIDTMHFVNGAFRFYLFSPLLLLIFQDKKTAAKNILKTNKLFKIRFFCGVYLFILPTLFCGFAPMWLPSQTIASIDPNYFLLKMKSSSIGLTPQRSVGELVAGKTVEQTFRAEDDKLSYLSFMLVTCARRNNSHILVSLLNDDGNTLVSKEVDTSKLKDNYQYVLDIPTISNSKNTKYHLKISTDAITIGNAVTLWITGSHTYQSGSLNINQTPIAGDLVMKLYYKT